MGKVEAKKFVQCFKDEMEYCKKEYLEGEGTYVSKQINEMNLDEFQQKKLGQLISSLLNDTYYTILMGLDGSASIGGNQEIYKIYDENGNLIGDLAEGDLWEQFNEG